MTKLDENLEFNDEGSTPAHGKLSELPRCPHCNQGIGYSISFMRKEILKMIGFKSDREPHYAAPNLNKMEIAAIYQYLKDQQKPHKFIKKVPKRGD